MTDQEPPNGWQLLRDVKRSLRILIVATVVLYGVLIGGGVKVFMDSSDTNRALCAFRSDLGRRIVASTQYLKDRPEGAPGIPAKTILDQISNQQRTVLSLRDLDCPNNNQFPKASLP